ncbi:MAG: hypothetical protein HY053_05235, partial [Proteobacteria bacterium]|nr:hypothetical protein [Pseudomonadota bacterium]
ALAITRLKEKIPEFSQNLAEIGQQKDGQDGGIVGGLAQRVERSEFYQEQFEKLTSHLGIQEIGGFVSYQKAVIGRLGGLHELIKLIGKRFARLQQTLNLLTSQQQMSESIETTSTTAKMLQLADFIIWQFFVPYYGSHTLESNVEKDPWLKHFFEELSADYKAYIWHGMLLVGTLGAHRHWIFPKKARQWVLQLAKDSAKAMGRRSIAIGRNTIAGVRTAAGWARTAAEVSLSKTRRLARYRYALIRYRLRTGRSHPAQLRGKRNRDQLEP